MASQPQADIAGVDTPLSPVYAEISDVVIDIDGHLAAHTNGPAPPVPWRGVAAASTPAVAVENAYEPPVAAARAAQPAPVGGVTSVLLPSGEAVGCTYGNNGHAEPAGALMATEHLDPAAEQPLPPPPPQAAAVTIGFALTGTRRVSKMGGYAVLQSGEHEQYGSRSGCQSDNEPDYLRADGDGTDYDYHDKIELPAVHARATKNPTDRCFD